MRRETAGRLAGSGKHMRVAEGRVEAALDWTSKPWILAAVDF